MKIKKWSKKFLIGNSEIDKQHKRMFDLYSELFIKEDATTSDLSIIFNSMLIWAFHHLAEEEKIIASLGYKDIEEHKHSHKVLIKMLDSIFLDQQTVETIKQSSLKIIELWSTHILDVDMKYSYLFL